jgi:DNA adenine methylase
MSLPAPSSRTITRPLLRYPGGKWRIAHWIVNHLPDHRVYVEPFGGAASVLLCKPIARAEVYNDLDGDLVNLFRVLRENGDLLIKKLSLTPFSREEFKLSYQFNSEDPIEMARRLIVRSFMGYGSTSFSRKTGFNPSLHRSNGTSMDAWLTYPTALKMAVVRLRGVCIENLSAWEVIKKYDSTKSLFYVDPPYPMGLRGNEIYYRHEFSESDHRYLAKLLRCIQGQAVVSCYPCDLYDDLYRGWTKITHSARSGSAQLSQRIEVLYLKGAGA